ncbi:hypothetical protein Sjap_013701 [Stephania japonica]|uniref:4-coumarate--CoA ligase n=1 Tax=Stephania japonica TaxID=461633 RepID=A0AAP0IYD3_9MAGN
MATDQLGWLQSLDQKLERSGFSARTGIYHSLHQLGHDHQIPTQTNLNIATYVLSHFPGTAAESRLALIDSITDSRLTYAQLRLSVHSFASALHHAIGIQKGDVVFVLSPNSLLYPIICLSVLFIGAVLTTANPLNTRPEIAKQVYDSNAKLIISSPEQAHKFESTTLPVLITTRSASPNDNVVTVEELIEAGDPLGVPEVEVEVEEGDTAAVLYSSGTTGVSKGVVLTHGNLVAVTRLLRWTVDVSSAREDVFLCFIPMFHVYGLAFFGLGLFSVGVTVVVMPKFDFKAMLQVVERCKVNNMPGVPPLLLGLVKTENDRNLSSLKRVGSGAAPLSKEVAAKFREKYPWVELREGYGLTETSGATSYFVSDDDAKAHHGSVGQLLPGICAKVVDAETGEALPPNRKGELWLKSPTVMKCYLGNKEATAATIDKEGWLRTGDLCYIDGDGFIYIVDRIKELIKHNGYQVAPAELEALLLSHTKILDAAVVPVPDEETGQIPMAFVVRAANSELTEEQVIDFVASQVAPYKKVRRVSFIDAIPRSAAGKILRKELLSQTQSLASKL